MLVVERRNKFRNNFKHFISSWESFWTCSNTRGQNRLHE